MASDQNTGAEVFIFAESPAGDRKRLFSGVNEQTGPGGSPDGAQATVKANELPVMGRYGFPVKGGWKLVLATRLKVADGCDASDAVVNVPITDAQGNVRYLTASDFGYDVDLPASTPVGLIIDLGEGYTVPEGDTVYLGGGTYFISVEDDTA